MKIDINNNIPIQVLEATEIKYLPELSSMTAQPVCDAIYRYKNKWWLVTWYGMWLVKEWDGNEIDLCNTEDEAIERAKNIL